MVDAELARSKQRCAQLEAAVKTRDAEITKLARSIDQSEVSARQAPRRPSACVMPPP